MARKYTFSVETYLAAPVSLLVAARPRRFPLFIYLKKNDHLLLRFAWDCEMTDAHLAAFKFNSIENLWVPKQYEKEWQAYLRGEIAAAPEPLPNATIEEFLGGENVPEHPLAHTPEAIEDQKKVAEAKLADANTVVKGGGNAADGSQTVEGDNPNDESKDEFALAEEAAKKKDDEIVIDGVTQKIKDNEAQTVEGTKEQSENTEVKSGTTEEEVLLKADGTPMTPEEAAAHREAEAAKMTEEAWPVKEDGTPMTPEEAAAYREAKAAEAEAAQDASAEEENLDSDEARSEEAAVAIDVLTTDEFSEEEKKEVLKDLSKNALNTIATVTSDSPEARKEAVAKMKEFTDDVVKVAAKTHAMKSFYDEIMSIKELQTEHSGAVSAYAVIFAMGAGFTDPESLADIAMGSLLHDIGYVALNPLLVTKTESQMNANEIAEFKQHVTKGLEVLQKKNVEMTPGVREIVAQHHERFDGSGYPNAISGLQLSDLAQIVAIADYLDDHMTGRMDGKEHTPIESMQAVKNLQTPGSGKQLFNPEIFEMIVQLIEQDKLDQGNAA